MNELCQVVVQASTTHALRGVVNNVQVLFNVMTGHTVEDTETKRPPINLAIVLDRSGSMDSGQKLKNAKLAIKKVIEALGADDILHLVLYGSEVELAFQNASVKDRESLLARVDQVVTEGMTNMHAGLDKGSQVVSEYAKQGYTNRIFLFSDGLVNEGVTNKQEIYRFISQIYTERDTKVSAFGLGNDFDEELMKSIAEHGSGAYFFIEGSAAIPRFVDFALKGLFKLVGTDAGLKIRGLNGAVVTKIYSHHDLTKPYQFGDLKQDDHRSAVCELQVTPSVQPSEEVLTWELEYRPASNAEETLSSERAVIKGTLRIHFTDNEEDVAKGENPQVLAKVAIQRTGELDAELIGLISSGKTKEAIALTEKEIEILRSALDKDLDGSANIANHLKHVETALADLHREGASKANMKKAHHRNYMKRRASICYEQQYISDEMTKAAEDEDSPPSSPPASPPTSRAGLNRRNLPYS